MVELTALVALAAMVLTGHGVLAAAGLERARGRIEWFFSAALAGAAALMALALLTIWLVGPLPVWGGRLLLLLPAGFGLAAWLKRRPDHAPLPPRAPGGFLEAGPAHFAALALLALLVGLVLFTAASAPTHLFDPTFHFAFKGKVLFHEGLSVDAFADAEGHVGRVMTHPSYPPGIGLFQLLPSWVGGEFSPHGARALLALFALAPAAWLHAALLPRGRGAALTAALLWLSLPVLFYLRVPNPESSKALVGLVVGPELGESLLGGKGWRAADGPVLDGGGDLPLAAFFFGALVHLWRLLRVGAKADRADLVSVALCATGMLLVKNEGLALLVLLLAITPLVLGLEALVARGRRLPWRNLGLGSLALVLGAVLTLPWFAFESHVPDVDESYPDRLTLERLGSAWSEPVSNDGSARLTTPASYIADEFASSLLDPLAWNLLWPLFLAALLLGLLRPRRATLHAATLPLAATTAGLVLFFLILTVTPWQLSHLFATGIPDRLFLQVAPTAVLAVALMAFAPRTEGDPTGDAT
ncbi:MAG: hypothetical protein P1V81_17005 [Planctomycetota bacterium]|nr:hypothetical protein [Planctomycetota bacterium]